MVNTTRSTGSSRLQGAPASRVLRELDDDKIKDFVIGEDKIAMAGYDLSDIDDLSIEQDGDDTVIDGYEGSNSITLNNINKGDLSDDDFIFLG